MIPHYSNIEIKMEPIMSSKLFADTLISLTDKFEKFVFCIFM